MKVLVAVDLQNDFINGALGTAEAAAMLPGPSGRSAPLRGWCSLPEIPTPKTT